MCGIAGMYNFKGPKVSRDQLCEMTDSLFHRGPDGEGQWVDSAARIGLGHRRLSILDLSEQGIQPMHFEGRFSITFNGEIYNYVEIRQELEKKGHRFKTQTDTEVLLVAYANYGADCLEQLDGMFAFAIWDQEDKSLFIARDRFGEKPLYYYFDDGRFVFASEMKALFAAGIPQIHDPGMLFKYLAYDVVADPEQPERTFYKDIKKLPPANWVRLQADGSFKQKRYWQIETLPASNHYGSQKGALKLSAAKIDANVEAEAVRQFREILERSVARRMRSDVPVGSSLSGGLDSSSIVMLMRSFRRGTSKPQATFSARFQDPKLDEGRYMELINGQNGLTANYTWPDAGALHGQLEELFFHQEEPFGSASILAQWEVMKLAKQNDVTVLLDGQGADEILAGYTHFFKPFLSELYLHGNGSFDQELAAYKEVYGKDYHIDWRFKLDAKAPGILRKLGNLRRQFSKPNYFNGLHQEFVAAHKGGLPPFRIWPDLNRSLAHATSGYGLENLLRFSDRNAMAHSREVRLPFLSVELVNFLFQQPAHLKIRGGWTKYLLRKSMDDLLPKEISWRKDKLGFEPPQKDWMSDPNMQLLVADARETLRRENIVSAPAELPAWRCLMAAQLLTKQFEGVRRKRA